MAKLVRRVPGRRLVLALALVCLLAALFRLVNLADNPGWDGDEGYNWSIATQLLAGHVQRFALKYTFVDHPPLFYLLCAAVMRVWTTDLLALRVVSAVCGVLTCGALYLLGDRLANPRLGILAAAVYGLWPQAIVQSRWAYSYTTLGLLTMLALWAALPGRATTAYNTAPPSIRKCVAAGLLAGCALATDQEGISALVGVLVLIYGHGGWRQAAITLACGLGVPALYVLWMLWLRGNALLFDVTHTAGRLGGGGVLTQLSELLTRLIDLWQFDIVTLLGMAGLLLLPAGTARRAILATLAVLLLLVLKIRDPNPYFRAAIPLLPLTALGVGVVIAQAWQLITQGLLTRTGPRVLALAACLLFVAATVSVDAEQALTGYTTAIASSLPRSTRQARAMAAWVNSHVRPDQYVIAMPQVAWLLHCRTAELLQAVAITGHGTAFYPDGLTPARFAFDTRLQAATLLVVDHFTDLWDSSNPRERALVQQARTHWTVAYRLGEYTIYRNPSPLNPAGA